MARIGILLMGYGGPESLDDVGPFLQSMIGRAPSTEMLERVRARYASIGGGSPLPRIADRIATKLQSALSADGFDVRVAVGMRHWSPYIAEALAGLEEQGIERVITVSLGPFESFASSGAYRQAVSDALVSRRGMRVVEAPSFRTAEGFLSGLAAGCSVATKHLAAASPSRRVAIVFSAHSLPVEACSQDPYEAELAEAASAVAARAGLPAASQSRSQTWLPGIDAVGSEDARTPWLLAYQSKGQRPGAWLGPDISQVIAALPSAGFSAVASCPIGFSTDHLETLYDLDVQAAKQASEQGLEFSRAAVPNDSDEMIASLVATVSPLLRDIRDEEEE